MIVNAHNIIQHDSMADAFPDSTNDDQVLLLQKDFQFQQPMVTIPTIKMPTLTEQVRAVVNHSGETHATVRPTLTQNQVVRASSVKKTKRFDDYAYLGDYKCCTKDSCADPKYSWGWENETECQKKCDDDKLCYGYSYSGSSCLNWHEESLSNGGEKWGKAGCHLKMSAYTTAYGYTHVGANSCRNTNGDVPSAKSKTLHLYECSHECANSETCYGFSWDVTEQCDLWQEEIEDAEGTSSSHCWKKPFFKPTLDLDHTKAAFKAANGDTKNLPSFAILQKYVLRAGITSVQEFSYFIANMMQETDRLRTKTEDTGHYTAYNYDWGGDADGQTCDTTCPEEEDKVEAETTCCGDGKNKKWRDADCETKCTKHYFGRGYLQTTWRLNYVKARDYGHCNEDEYGNEVDIVEEPEKVAEDEVLAWCTAAHFWKVEVHDDRCVIDEDGHTCSMGNTIDAINGDQECGTTNEDKEEPKNRFCYFAAFYDSYTTSLGEKIWPDTDGDCISKPKLAELRDDPVCNTCEDSKTKEVYWC